MRHEIIVAKIRNGNVQHVARHGVATARAVARLSASYTQIWMTRETAGALGLNDDAIDTNNVHIKSADVMATA